jgi:hypothetical protein
MIPTAIMTAMAWAARRRVKASIGSFHCFLMQVRIVANR